MKIAFLLLVLLVSPIGAEEQPVFEMSLASQKALTIGHVAQVEFIIKNVSDQKLVLLEIQPGQPCEEPIELVRTLYGKIDYDPKADEYRYDSLVQTATMIPVVEGLLFPGEEVTLKEDYRPFADEESFTLSYAMLINEKVYAGNRQMGFQPPVHAERNQPS